MQDAMDVDGVARRAAPPADGEVVWSRYPDADIKLATMLTHRAGDGGKKARLTRESTKEAVKTNRAGNAGVNR
ncbi:hypothetical protein [Bradyrhizobium sp.]|uniref:hypothetical protein n=1 Tax=Bradyrhizobium sp. TaxID=376 RepID=UPI002D5EDE11|nr:hypothetical protein [Bradyrhizobium sp.]HZR74134.1 hypothetical protein [Bradyrhizobium sp.]